MPTILSYGSVGKLADPPDLGSGSERSVGSSPTRATKIYGRMGKLADPLDSKSGSERSVSSSLTTPTMYFKTCGPRSKEKGGALSLETQKILIFIYPIE